MMQIGSVSSYLPTQPYAWATPVPSTDAVPAATPSQDSPDADQGDARDSQQSGGAAGASGKAGSRQERAQQEADLKEIADLAQRDREVRAHEQAHAAVGGAHAGSPSYTYTRGPDGKSYATAGEVGIDTGAVSGDPEATMRKMDVVQRAALAPAEPSAQDRRVAAQAQARSVEAQGELTKVQREERVQETEEERLRAEEAKSRNNGDDSTSSETAGSSVSEALHVYMSVSTNSVTGPGLDVTA